MMTTAEAVTQSTNLGTLFSSVYVHLRIFTHRGRARLALVFPPPSD
ncbi:hypothetical protein LR68_02482 [Anoxybacillus sp. BCO1]|nr:hypothetical protein LR68_02482 [Anoxybacillus sp. BCO1]